jgi:inhibitor of cysteine peptidase
MTGRRWIALVVLLAVGVGLLVTVVVVPWGDDAPASNNPGVYHEGEDVSVAEGDEFVVALPANPSTGYAWTVGENPDVAFVSSRQVSGGTEPGSPGTQQLTFRGSHAGASTLALAYARSFEAGVPPAKTAKFAVTVTT